MFTKYFMIGRSFSTKQYRVLKFPHRRYIVAQTKLFSLLLKQGTVIQGATRLLAYWCYDISGSVSVKPE